MHASVAPAVVRHLESRIAAANLTIRLNFDVLDRLGAAVLEGFKAVPRRGLEIGGLLLGRSDSDRVVVDDFVPVASEHQRGPSWLLSDKDKESLAREISRVQAEQGGPRVVGIYRSHTRPGFAPAEEDRALTAAHCPAQECVFLLVKPEAGAPATAAWFAAGRGFWGDPEQFPFERRQLLAGGFTVSEADAPPAPRTPPPVDLLRKRMAKLLEAAAQPLEILPPPPPSRRRPWLAPAAILLCAGAAGYLAAAWWTKEARVPASAPPPLALRVTFSEGSLHLRWDRHAPLVRDAAGGVVWIEDGGKQRRLDLQPADLTEGSIQYWPSSSDVRFKMELAAPQRGSESIRAIGIPLPKPPEHRPPTAAARLARVHFEALKSTAPRRAGARSVVPPKPLTPVIPADPARAADGEVLINVRVAIDSTGKVMRAELLSKTSAATREWEALALQSSRRWTFTPARQGGRRVAGKGILHFRFGNPVLARAAAPGAEHKTLEKP